jgi:hypothetical protein
MNDEDILIDVLPPKKKGAANGVRLIHIETGTRITIRSKPTYEENLSEGKRLLGIAVKNYRKNQAAFSRFAKEKRKDQ